jgi:hypothetical protein
MIRVPSGLNWENATYVSHCNGLKMGVPPQRARRLSRATSTLLIRTFSNHTRPRTCPTIFSTGKMTPPPSMSFNTNEGSIREFVSRLVTSILEASQSSRESVQETIEKSKAERAISQNKNFKPFPPLDHVLDLGIISDCDVKLIMPAQALENLDKSLQGYLEVSLTSLEATKWPPFHIVLMSIASIRIKVSPGPKSAKNPPNPPGPHLSWTRCGTGRSFKSQLTQTAAVPRVPNGITYTPKDSDRRTGNTNR